MAKPKAAKVDAEILKFKAKLSEVQSKLRELESKRTEIENMEIVDIVRGLNIPLDELSALLRSIKGGAALAAVPVASGQLGPKSPQPQHNDKEEPEE